MYERIDAAIARIGRYAASKGDPWNLGHPMAGDPLLMNAQANVGTANRMHLQRVVGGGTITKLRIYVAAQSGNIVAAIYRNTGSGLAAAPGALVVSSGTIACPVAGKADIALGASYAITSGDFWFGLAADNTTAQFGMFGTNGWLTDGRYGYIDTAIPAPATAGALTAGNRPLVLVGVA